MILTLDERGTLVATSILAGHRLLIVVSLLSKYIFNFDRIPGLVAHTPFFRVAKPFSADVQRRKGE